MPCWSNQASAWLSWSLLTICDAADAAMKAASGETVNGGDIKLYATVDGRSLDMLWALDREGILVVEGETTPEDGRDTGESMVEETMAAES